MYHLLIHKDPVHSAVIPLIYRTFQRPSVSPSGVVTGVGLRAGRTSAQNLWPVK